MIISKIELQLLSDDLAEIMIKSKYNHKELYEFDDTNKIFIITEEKNKELEQLVNDLQQYITSNFIVEIIN